MANPSKAKGTEYENHVLETYLFDVWGRVDRDRARGAKDYGDFKDAGGWLLEARKRNAWRLPSWIRDIYGKLARAGRRTTGRWAIIFAADKRTELRDDYVATPASTFFGSLALLKKATMKLSVDDPLIDEIEIFLYGYPDER